MRGAANEVGSIPAEDLAVSATVPDWSREAVSPLAWDPPRQLLRTLRRYEALRARGVPRVALAPIIAAMIGVKHVH